MTDSDTISAYAEFVSSIKENSYMILNPKTRQVWAEKTFELTNIGAGALLFGQFFSDKGFSLLPTLLGLLLIILGYVIVTIQFFPVAASNR